MSGARLSIARLAVFTLGAGVAVLIVSTPVIYGVAQVSPPAALVVAVLAIVLMIAVMALTSNRMVNRAVAVAKASAVESDPSTAQPAADDES